MQGPTRKEEKVRRRAKGKLNKHGIYDTVREDRTVARNVHCKIIITTMDLPSIR